MPRITLDLIRKKSEHHDGDFSSLIELSLHQLGIERIELLNRVCPRLQILYLQNNLIERLENLTRMRDLRYLNVALNNIRVIENLHSCEALDKLDLTVNFIGIDRLRESLTHLALLPKLRELYFTGNPCTQFSAYRQLCVLELPTLQRLDGSDVTRSERLEAQRNKENVYQQLQEAVRNEKLKQKKEADEKKPQQQTAQQAENAPTESSSAAADSAPTPSSSSGDGETHAYTPELRRAMYLEESEAKRSAEEAKNHSDASATGMKGDLYAEARAKLSKKVTDWPSDSDSLPPQRNTARFAFTLVEPSAQNAWKIVLRVALPRYLDSSAIDVDVHPQWLQIITAAGGAGGGASNLLLHAPLPVLAEKTRLQRVTHSGELIVTLTPAAANVAAAAANAAASAAAQSRKEKQRTAAGADAELPTAAAAAAVAAAESDDEAEDSDSKENDARRAAPAAAAVPQQPVSAPLSYSNVNGTFSLATRRDLNDFTWATRPLEQKKSAAQLAPAAIAAEPLSQLPARTGAQPARLPVAKPAAAAAGDFDESEVPPLE
jgi:protein TilB